MNKFQHGGQIYDEFGQEIFWHDFSANINPLGLSEKMRAAILENLDGVKNYPDPDATELKFAISQRYKIDEKNLVVLNGATEFFYLYFFVTRPKKILIPVPSFSEYERAALAAGCEVEYFFTFDKENFKIDTEKLLKEVQEKNFDFVILGRPNNPTGQIISLDEIKKIAEATKIIVDESFIDFANIESARKLVSKNICVVQSLTKIFGIPGLRLGFAVVAESLAEKLNMSKDVWNVNFLAQKVGAVALADEKFFSDTKSWLTAEKNFITERLKNLGVKFFEPTANFILLRLNSAGMILKKLREKKFLARSCENFVGLDEKYLRVAIRSREENILLLDALEEILKNV